MTNKLPEVGKQYKAKVYYSAQHESEHSRLTIREGELFKIENITVTDGKTKIFLKDHCGWMDIDFFQKFCQELPEDKAEEEISISDELMKKYFSKDWQAVQRAREDKAETKPDEKTMKRKNRILCKICLDIIESKHCHDYVTCSCGAISADGGNDYFKRGGKAEDMVDLAFPERLVDVATAAKETINLKKEDEVKVSDVEKAKGELRHYMTYPDLSDEATQWHRLFKKAQALLDALDAEKK